MNGKDISFYQSQCSVGERKGYVTACIGREATAGISEEEYVATKPKYPFEELKDGLVFDLGGIHIESYEFAGHTKGCMIFLIREEGILILGDACNNATILFDNICSTVTEYQIQVNWMVDLLAGRYGRVFIMHHIMEAPVSIFHEMLDVCDAIFFRYFKGVTP